MTAYYPGSDSHNAAIALKNVLEDEGWQITVVSNPHEDGIELLRTGQCDLAVTSNDISINPTGLRTILPLYHEVLTTLINRDSKIYNMTSLAEIREYIKNGDAKIMFSEEGSYAHLLAKRLLEQQGIGENDYTAYYLPRIETDYHVNKIDYLKEVNPDIVYLLGTDENALVDMVMQLGFGFFSASSEVDQIDASYSASVASKMPRCFPVVIPKYSFSLYQEQPVLTLGIYTSLVSNKSMDETSAYELAREIVNSFPQLVITNSSFVDLQENFDRKLLHYKLHPGARDYLDRDEPGFFERYAEVSGVIFSMFVFLVTVLASMNRIVKQRKKDRIDIFFSQAQEARANTDPREGLQQLEELQNTAFSQLSAERLSADESFIVFMQLVSQIRDELKEKVKSR